MSKRPFAITGTHFVLNAVNDIPERKTVVRTKRLGNLPDCLISGKDPSSQALKIGEHSRTRIRISNPL